ncbi:MAG: flagellar hook-associated protein FlgK [Pseudomonadota bacterium]
MADLLNIGKSALYAAQKSLDLTGHNIANVGTEGYSRQRIDQSALPGGSVSRLDVGAGVVVNGTTRLSDALVESRLVRDGAEVARLTAFDSLATRADTLLSDSSTGLSGSLNQLFSGFEQLAVDPSSTATRQAVLGQAESFANRLGDLHAQLSSIDSEIDQRLSQAVSTINDLASAIGQLNHRIAEAGSNTPADLLDARSQLVQQLSEQVGISTTVQDDGSLNVFASSGQPLVVGDRVSLLGTADDLYRPGRLDIVGGSARISSQLSGGTVGGLLDARRNLIDPALEKLGRVAVTLTSRINAVQAEGVLQDGSVGSALFSAPSGVAFSASTNTGSATAAVSFGNTAQLTGDDYLLRSTGTGWQLTRARSGEAVSFTGTGSSSDPLVVEGVRITLSGSAASGDSFRISPTHDAASQVQLLSSDPRSLATAGRLGSSAALANTGSAKPGAPTVVDGSNAQLATPATITFLSASSYQIGSGPAVAFAAGDRISANGWSLTLAGVPQAGDQFSVSATPPGSSDNRNARALAGIAQEKLLDGSRNTISQANNALVTQTGTTTLQVRTAKAAAEAVRTQSQNERDAVSGVNLDEEAANLLRYQQAYQAAAQVIATASTVFDTLLAATRR